MATPDNVHGTLVAVADRGVLLTGPSGAGKSDLALRLIDRGGLMVSDDQVFLELQDGRLLGTAPKRLRGWLEVRGVGIVPVPVTGAASIDLVVRLVDRAQVPRLPEMQQVSLLGRNVPVLHLNAFEVSAPIKIEWVLRHPDWIASGGPDDNQPSDI